MKPNFDLTGKTVLITGASRGIGRAIAEACWRSGADLILGVRNPVDVADIVKSAGAQGRRALPVALDLDDLKSCRAAITEAHKAMGRIAVLVNNVGIGP